MKALRIDHVAFPSFDAAATHRFYTEVLGSSLIFAMYEESSTWGKQFLLTAYTLGEGASIDFFEYEGIVRPGDDGLPKDIRHIGLAVESPEAIARWQEKLAALGVASYTEEHGEGDIHLYFSDPNGVLFEMTAEAHTIRPGRMEASEALAILGRWTSAHH